MPRNSVDRLPDVEGEVLRQVADPPVDGDATVVGRSSPATRRSRVDLPDAVDADQAGPAGADERGRGRRGRTVPSGQAKVSEDRVMTEWGSRRLLRGEVAVADRPQSSMSVTVRRPGDGATDFRAATGPRATPDTISHGVGGRYRETRHSVVHPHRSGTIRIRRTTAVTDRPVVLIAEELSPATVEALGPDFEIRHCNGADRGELLPAIVDVDAILVRSATKVDAEALAAAKRLKVVARAGVGLDNVDVRAATQSGVMVVNAPTSNIVSAAELAVALMLAAARHVSPAHAALKNGEWKRSKYTGIELYEKTVGIVGLGRIGVLVAQRLSAFGMNVIAYDPYVQAGRAAQMGVRLVDLDTLLAESDFMSVHLPKTPETVGPDRRRPARQGQAVPGAGQRRPRRHRRRGSALRRAQEGPDRRRRPRRVRQRAVHRQPALRARERRRHAAPRRLDRRGPGEGRHRGRQVGAARALPASWCPTRSTCRAA